MHEPHITLIVAIDRDGDHIRGTVGAAGGRTRPFEGRIGLMAAIDAFVAGDPRAPTPPTTQESTE